MSLLIRICIFSLILGGIILLNAQDRKATVVDIIDGDELFRVLEPDAIPAIRHPEFLNVVSGNEQMEPDEPVLGLIIGNEKRAYSLWQLDHHEIVNDQVDGVPLAVTW